MRFLRLGHDIVCNLAQPELATVTFKIKNKSAVDIFMTQKEMLAFLGRPDTDDEGSGCSTTVTQCGDYLSIQNTKKCNLTSILQVKVMIIDLLSTIKTYIMPEGSEGDSTAIEALLWTMLIQEMMSDKTCHPSQIPLNKSLTGAALIHRDIYEKDGIPYVTPSLCR